VGSTIRGPESDDSVGANGVHRRKRLGKGDGRKPSHGLGDIGAMAAYYYW